MKLLIASAIEATSEGAWYIVKSVVFMKKICCELLNSELININTQYCQIHNMNKINNTL